MPNIQVYVNDEIYINFLRLSEDTRKETRNKITDLINDMVRKNETLYPLK